MKLLLSGASGPVAQKVLRTALADRAVATQAVAQMLLAATVQQASGVRALEFERIA